MELICLTILVEMLIPLKNIIFQYRNPYMCISSEKTRFYNHWQALKNDTLNVVNKAGDNPIVAKPSEDSTVCLSDNITSTQSVPN